MQLLTIDKLKKYYHDRLVIDIDKFEILEDGEVVKTTMVNEQVVIEVPNTGLSDYYVVEIISGLLMLGGIGVIIYAKKKKRK